MKIDHLQYSYVALPPATILEKIKMLDPEGPASIMDTAEWIGECARMMREEDLRKEQNLNKTAVRGFLQGVSDLFNLFSVRRPALPDQASTANAKALENDWIHIGNDIRMAIKSYFKHHPDIEKSIKLTGAEQAGLRLVPLHAVRKAHQALSR